MPPETGVPYAEVIGDPVAHSKSPLIHQYWLRKLQISGEYRRTHVRRDELAGFLRDRRLDRDWRGCNVTVPHKETVIASLDRLDPRAAAVGAVNCVVAELGGLIGYNSDVDGVAAALAGLALDGAKAALIGAGGAARAAMAYLAESRVAEVSITARNCEKAERLRAIAPNARIEVGAFNRVRALFDGSAVVINGSPLGMDGCPEMPDDVLDTVSRLESATLFDMVYSPLETRFLSAGRGPRVNGLAMLVGQASRAFELFYGTAAPPSDRPLFDLLAG